MSLSLWCVNICQLLGFCGLTSIRMFLPTFLYFLVLRLSVAFPKFFPRLVIETSSRIPAWQISNVFLTVLGILAVAEIVAMRCPEVKKFLTDYFDKIAKPLMTVFVLSGVISAQQQAEINSILGATSQVCTAAFLSPYSILAFLGGGLTYLCCKIRSGFFELIYNLDPDGSLGILKIVNSGEEIFLLIGFLLVIFAPVFALVILVAGGILSYVAKKAYAKMEKKHYHHCLECNKSGRQTDVFDSALVCPVCGTKQPNVYRLGFLGLPSGKIIATDKDLEQHIFDLQKSKRCRFCASRLKQNNVCDVCGNSQWSKESIASFKSQMRKRELVFAGLAILSLIYPLVAVLLFLVLFNFFLIRPYLPYLSHSQSFIAKFIFAVLKIILVGIMLFLSTIPFIGILALLPFLIRYLYVKNEFYRNIQAE